MMYRVNFNKMRGGTGLFYIFLINGGTGDVQGKFYKKGGEEDDRK